MHLLSSLQAYGVADTGTLRANRDMKAPLTSVATMNKRNVELLQQQLSFNIFIVRWKDSRTVSGIHLR